MRWRWRLAAVMLLISAGGVRAEPAPQAVAGGPTVEDGYFEVAQPLAPHVWVIRQAKPFHLQPIGNVLVVEQSDGLVMLDSGGSPGSGRRIVALVKSLSPKPVKAIFISHWHGDHAMGLPAVLQAWPKARVIASAATRRHLGEAKTQNAPPAPDAKANAALLEKYRGFIAYGRDQAAQAKSETEREGWLKLQRLATQYVHDMDGALTLQPAEGYARRLVIADAQAPVEALFLGRANTDGDAEIWLPRQRILASGDTVVSPVPYGFGSYPKDWIGVLQKLRAYPFRTLVPGHGEPQHDRAYLDRLIALIQAVRAQVGPLARQGLSLKTVEEKVDLSAQRKAFVGDDPWLGQWFDQYWSEPIVRSAYKEARGEPIVQSLKGD